MRLYFSSLTLIMSMVASICIAQNTFNKPGNVTFGVILPVHQHVSVKSCTERLYVHGLGLGYVETIAHTVDEINKNSKIHPNVSLGFQVWDYCGSDYLAVKAAHEIITNNMLWALINDNGVNESKIGSVGQRSLAVLGTLSSQSTSYVASQLQENRIPIISPFATSDNLATPFFSAFFRTVPPDSMQAAAMVSVIEHFNWTYVAILALDDLYGQYGARAIQREAYNRRTFCVAITEYFTNSLSEDDYIASINNLKKMAKVRVIVFWGNQRSAVRLFQVAKKLELYGRTFLMSEAMFTLNPEALAPHAGVLNGAIGVVPRTHARAVKLEEHFKSLTPKSTRGGLPWWGEFWKQEFNCSSSSGIITVPECNDSASLSVSGMRRMTNDYTPFIIDAVYAIAHALRMINGCSAGADLSISACRPHEVITNLREISFVGKTGRVQFAENGNRKKARYSFLNFQKYQTGYRFETIGEWSETDKIQYVIRDSLIRWNTYSNKVPVSVCEYACAAGYKQVPTSECCWKCIGCPVDTVNPIPGSPNCTKCPEEQTSNKLNTKCVPRQVVAITWGERTAWVFVSFAVLGILMSVFVLGLFIKYKDSPVVRSSNPELSFLLLSMNSLLFILTFLYLAEPSDALCRALQPWRYITCTFSVSIFVIKINRILKAFNTVVPMWAKKLVMDPKRQIATVVFLNVIQIILTTLWLQLDPPYLKREIKTFIFIKCSPFKTATGAALRAIMFAYLIFMAIMCAFYAFKARKLPESFNEARYIGFSLYILLLSWIAYYPCDSALEGSAITTVSCATALVIAYGVLVCMFFPKVFTILWHPEQNTKEFVNAEVGMHTFSSNGTARFEQNRAASQEPRRAASPMGSQRSLEAEFQDNHALDKEEHPDPNNHF